MYPPSFFLLSALAGLVISSPAPQSHRPLPPDSIFSCPAASWPPGIGSLLVPQKPDAELRQILSEIDPKRIENIIKKLVSFGTRHTLSDQTSKTRGIGAARDWIEGEMRGFAEKSGGRMEVTVPSYIQGVDVS